MKPLIILKIVAKATSDQSKTTKLILLDSLLQEIACHVRAEQPSRQMMVDEMFPDGPGNLDYVDAEDGIRDGVGGPAVLLNDLTANDKTVHADFFHNFGDLFDDNDLN
jgi:hypothetical protein